MWRRYQNMGWWLLLPPDMLDRTLADANLSECTTSIWVHIIHLSFVWWRLPLHQCQALLWYFHQETPFTLKHPEFLCYFHQLLSCPLHLALLKYQWHWLPHHGIYIYPLLLWDIHHHHHHYCLWHRHLHQCLDFSHSHCCHKLHNPQKQIHNCGHQRGYH